MKKLLPVLSFMFIIFIMAFGQTILLKELIEITACDSLECFNNYILKKGFSPVTSTDQIEKSRTFCLYKSDSSFQVTSNRNQKNQNTISLSLFPDQKIRIDFRTSIQSHYHSLLDEIDQLKFEPVKSIGEALSSLSVEYKSSFYPQIHILVTVESDTTNSEFNLIDYSFIIAKN